MKPAGWPRYMLAKRLVSGAVAYYWNPPGRDLAAGFTLHPEPLGQDYGAAIARAESLNAHLDDWRRSRGAVRDIDLGPRAGSLDWLVERYYRSRAWGKVSARSRPAYRAELSLVTDMALKDGRRAGELAVASITARFVDRLYDRIVAGGRGNRYRQANVAVRRARRAWDAVHRLYPADVPTENPFDGVEMHHRRRETVPATRAEAYALAGALAADGHDALGLAALAAFEWHQRPEHLLGGVLAWSCWRPADHPRHIRIEHPKTGALVWMPLEDGDGALFPEIEDYIRRRVPRLGDAMVLTPGQRGPHRPYSQWYALAMVRRARRSAGLPEHVTLAGCRHGGMTELGDAEVTEAGIMSLSGHKTPEASRIYVKRTEAQRLAAARRRRAWVEAAGVESQNGESQNGISRRQMVRQ